MPCKDKVVSIDKFLDRRPMEGYNCLDLARETWLHICGEDFADRLPQPVIGKRLSVEALRSMSNFERLDRPVSPCLVLMRRFRLPPHVGVYIDGRILHLVANGVQLQMPEIATMYSSSVRYYR